jgi:hypothetical protein
VTLGEALAELGIDLDASPDQARRAYLRLLKTRKPETDPQGFMRLREAYDLAKRHVEMHATLRKIMEQRVEAEAAAPPAAPEGHSAGQVDHSAGQVDHSADQVDHSAGQVDHSAGQVDRSADPVDHSADQVDRSADPAGHSADQVDRSADPAGHSADQVDRSADPADHSADQVDRSADQVDRSAGQVDRSADREAHSADQEDRSTRSATQANGLADQEEPSATSEAAPAEPAADDEAPADDPDAPRRPSLTVVDLFLTAGQHADAARELARIFDAAVHDVVGPPPPLHRAVHLIVVLHGEGEVATARTLADSVAAWLRASGQEARLLRGDGAARWAVARELSALPEKFSSTVRVSIAQAALDGDLAQAKRELFAFQSRRPAAAAEAARLLRKKAPMLAAALADSLEVPLEPPKPPVTNNSGGGFRGVWAIVVAAMGLMRLLMATSSSTSHAPSFDPSRFSQRYTPPSFTFDGGGYRPPPSLSSANMELKKRALLRVDRMISHVDPVPDAGAVSKGRRDPAAAKLASELADEIEREDCVAARASARDLRARFVPDAGKAKDEIGRVEALTLEQAVTAYCDGLDNSRRTPEPSEP